MSTRFKLHALENSLPTKIERANSASAKIDSAIDIRRHFLRLLTLFSFLDMKSALFTIVQIGFILCEGNPRAASPQIVVEFGVFQAVQVQNGSDLRVSITFSVLARKETILPLELHISSVNSPDLIPKFCPRSSNPRNFPLRKRVFRSPHDSVIPDDASSLIEEMHRQSVLPLLPPSPQSAHFISALARR